MTIYHNGDFHCATQTDQLLRDLHLFVTWEEAIAPILWLTSARPEVQTTPPDYFVGNTNRKECGPRKV